MQRDSSPDTPTPVPADLQDASRAFFPDLTAIEGIAGHPDVARVTTQGGLRRVRRWPEGTPASAITFVHEVMHLARQAGLSIVPAPISAPGCAGDALVRAGGRFYDAQVWLPGEPPQRAEAAWPDVDDRVEIPVVLSPAHLAEVIAALAQLHEATTELAERGGVPAAPLAMLPAVVRQAQARHLAALRARARREPAIQRWLAIGERLIANAEPAVLAATEEGQHLPTSVLHLGLWPAHVLLDNDAVTGLLGWERAATGSPLLDLAQVTLRLRGWSDEAIEEVIATYSDVRPIAPEERRLLPAVAALDAVDSTGRLLEQTYAVEQTARPPTALRSAVDMMLRSMSALDRNLSAPPPGAKRRTWVHRPPPPGSRRQTAGGKRRERHR
jgi:Ser/Thr protein kinase RdoA (MazF antagonist)